MFDEGSGSPEIKPTDTELGSQSEKSRFSHPLLKPFSSIRRTEFVQGLLSNRRNKSNNLDNPKFQQQFEEARTKIKSGESNKYSGFQFVMRSLQSDENLRTQYIKDNIDNVVREIIVYGYQYDTDTLFHFIKILSLSDDPELKCIAIPTLPHFLNENRTLQNETTLLVLKEAIGNIGLDYDTVARAWLDSCSGSEYSTDDYLKQQHLKKIKTIMSNNLQTMFNLEAKQPGICKTLADEFGIYDFGRYPEDLLLSQYKSRDQHVPYALIAYPIADHNGTFYHRRDALQGLMDQLNERIALRVIEYSNFHDLIHKVVQLHRKYGESPTGHKTAFGVLGEHGTETAMGNSKINGKPYSYEYIEKYILGLHPEDRPENQQDKYSTITLRNLRRKGVQSLLEAFFQDGASLILDSCSTGKDEIEVTKLKHTRPHHSSTGVIERRKITNVAHEISKLGIQNHLRVIAPAEPTSIKSFSVKFTDNSADISVKYDKEGSARTYQVSD